jgi:hypothetical protein
MMRMTPPSVPPTIAATGMLEPLLFADFPLLSPPATPEVEVGPADDVVVPEEEGGVEVTAEDG